MRRTFALSSGQLILSPAHMYEILTILGLALIRVLDALTPTTH